MLEFNNVTFKYNGTGHGVYDIGLTVQRGECVLLCGASGCGKTTLIRLINGLAPSFYSGSLKGKISIGGADMTGLQPYETARKVSSVFQDPKAQFFNTDTGSEIVFSLENRGFPVTDINMRLEEAVEKFGLHDLLERSPSKMSGGQAQTVAFAAAYTADTDIVVLDEPTANLDENAITRIRGIITAMKDSGKTIVISEHRLSWLNGIADKVCYMKNGRILETYSGREFFAMSGNECSGLGLRALQPVQRTLSPNIIELGKNNSSTGAFAAEAIVMRRGKRKWDHPVSASFESGNIYCITGENGRGKTTFLRTLAGLEKQAAGSVIYSGKKLGKRARQRIVSMVFQKTDDQLFSDTVLGECLLGNGSATEENALEILGILELAEYRDAHPQSLSGGQRQRLAVGTAILSDKPVLLLDEPTSGLDLGSMTLTAQILRKAADNGKICIVVTHDNELINKLYESEDNNAEDIHR
ncbi:MAG: ABC transporter ATP-binding protein [Ruminiclostridium sp.]|nr:ABC transporter ATP-binding protein [Ruminiclostridium sp.]